MRDTIPRKQQTLHSAWCYTRIERVPGRPAAFVASRSVLQRRRTERGEQCPHVEGGQRSTNLPMYEPAKE